MPRSADPSWPSLDKGTYRFPLAGVSFDDVAMNWYMNQTEKPLAPTIGHLMDHVSLSVSNLDAWIAKLKGRASSFFKGPYHVGATRAVMIEGPSHEAIELIEGELEPGVRAWVPAAQSSVDLDAFQVRQQGGDIKLAMDLTISGAATGRVSTR